jgi:hypothetical protein
VLRTTNGGNNWYNVSGNGIPSALNLLNIFSLKSFSFDFYDFNYAYVAGTDSIGSYIYRTTNGGSNWAKVLTVTGTGARINAIWFRDTARGFAEGEPVSGRWSFWKTTNRGLTWDSAGLFLNGQNYSGFSNNISGKITPYSDSILYIGANYNDTETRVLRSTNFGNSWNILIPGINKPMTSIFFVKPEKGLIGGNNYISETTNSGNNWNLSASLPFTPNLVGIITDNYTIVKRYLKTDFAGLQSIYRGWYINNWDLEFGGIRGMRHMQGFDWKIWVVGDSGRIYEYNQLYPFIRKISSEIPERFLLMQNYPNPFNSGTKIRFDVKKSVASSQESVVILKVFDITGKEVTTLVNEQLNPGTYEVTFDGSNLPSGVYFYQLNSNNFSDTKKLILLK